MKASSAIPFVCHPYAVGNTLYYDGALGDTIPVQKAFQLGCDKVVLLLTLPEDTLRTADKDQKLAARIRKKYPLAAEKLEERAENYNKGVAFALRRLYEKGYQDGKRILDFLKNK